MRDWVVYIFIALSVIGNALAQLLLKRGMIAVGEYPHSLQELMKFFYHAFTNPYVLGAIFVTFLTALTWFAALSKWQLSYLYPFISLCYIIVAIVSFYWFKETISITRWIGISVICVGVFLVGRS